MDGARADAGGMEAACPLGVAMTFYFSAGTTLRSAAFYCFSFISARERSLLGRSLSIRAVLSLDTYAITILLLLGKAGTKLLFCFLIRVSGKRKFTKPNILHLKDARLIEVCTREDF